MVAKNGTSRGSAERAQGMENEDLNRNSYVQATVTGALTLRFLSGGDNMPALVIFHKASVRIKLTEIRNVKASLNCLYKIQKGSITRES